MKGRKKLFLLAIGCLLILAIGCLFIKHNSDSEELTEDFIGTVITTGEESSSEPIPEPSTELNINISNSIVDLPSEPIPEPSTELNISDSITDLPPERKSEQIMLISGSNGEAVAISGDIKSEDISDPVAKENYEQMLGLPEDTEKITISENNPMSEEESKSNATETLSHEQYSQIEQDIRAYTDKQADEWENEVYGKEESYEKD